MTRNEVETGVLNLIVKSLKCSAEKLRLCLLFREQRAIPDRRTLRASTHSPEICRLRSRSVDTTRHKRYLILPLHLITIHKESRAGKETAGTVFPPPPTLVSGIMSRHCRLCRGGKAKRLLWNEYEIDALKQRPNLRLF